MYTNWKQLAKVQACCFVSGLYYPNLVCVTFHLLFVQSLPIHKSVCMCVYMKVIGGKLSFSIENHSF
jgi:hypothetical protein